MYAVSRPRATLRLFAAAAALLLAACSDGASGPLAPTDAGPAALHLERRAEPSGTVVTDASGRWLATFTDGARTVTLAGPERVFDEATAAHPVRSRTWVRLLDRPFAGTVDTTWLRDALADRSPDVLATGMQYVAGAPDRRDDAGMRIAGDASYGPLRDDGTREEGSDFNDFLGIGWSYGPGRMDDPETRQAGAVDCSGFVRLVYGYRTGAPLVLFEPDGDALPRNARTMHAAGPGVLLFSSPAAPAARPAALRPGDLVFFDSSDDDGATIDHVGIYLGADEGGAGRFLSSRKTADGPTLGDLGGRATLDGGGFYARAFRAVRRI